MTRSTTLAAFTLALCALSDLAAVPLLSASGSDTPPTVIAPLVAVLGVATGIASVGLVRRTRWAGPAGIGTRLIDGIAALAGLAASDTTLMAAEAATLALSVAAIVLVLRGQATLSCRHEVPTHRQAPSAQPQRRTARRTGDRIGDRCSSSAW